jgi:hypothetical protein
MSVSAAKKLHMGGVILLVELYIICENENERNETQHETLVGKICNT